jgi:hypothetical protein
VRLAPRPKDGPQKLTWTVTDRLGNTATVERTVIADNTNPRLAITKAPKNRAKVTGTVTVKATASDRNGINRVELLINGKTVAKDTTAGYAFTIKTKKYSKKMTMRLRVYDKAGNITYTPVRTWRR